MKKAVILLIFGLCIANVWGQKKNNVPSTVTDTIRSVSVPVRIFTKIDSFLLADIPEVTDPPVLFLSGLTLMGVQNEGSISSGEKGFLCFKIKNTGEGDAYNLWLNVSETTGCPGLKYEKHKFITKQLRAGETRFDTIRIEGQKNLRDERTEFEFVLREAHGNTSPVAVINVSTREASRPNVDITNSNLYSVSAKDEIGIQLTIKNTGSLNQENVKVIVNYPKTVFTKGDNVITLQQLKPDETVDMNFTFAKNSLFNEALADIFKVKIEDSNGRMLGKESEIIRRPTVVRDSTQPPPPPPDSDIETPPRSVTFDQKNTNMYALIIGNENYVRYSNNPDVPYARNDAILFRNYCLWTFKIPNENIILYIDATGNQMRQGVKELARRAKYDDSKNPELIIYYSGHGIMAKERQSLAGKPSTDEDKFDQYLIPVDASDANPDLSLSRKDIFAMLNDIPIKRTSIFLDACNIKKYKGQMKFGVEPEDCKGNVFVFASSSENQSSIPYDEKKHGLFTYFLLKSIKDKNGIISYKDMFERVKNEVIDQSGSKGEIQTPKEFVSDQAKPIWEKWKLPQ